MDEPAPAGGLPDSEDGDEDEDADADVFAVGGN